MTNLTKILYHHINDRQTSSNFIMDALYKKHEWILYQKKEKSEELDDD